MKFDKYSPGRDARTTTVKTVPLCSSRDVARRRVKPAADRVRSARLQVRGDYYSIYSILLLST